MTYIMFMKAWLKSRVKCLYYEIINAIMSGSTIKAMLC